MISRGKRPRSGRPVGGPRGKAEAAAQQPGERDHARAQEGLGEPGGEKAVRAGSGDGVDEGEKGG